MEETPCLDFPGWTFQFSTSSAPSQVRSKGPDALSALQVLSLSLMLTLEKLPRPFDLVLCTACLASQVLSSEEQDHVNQGAESTYLPWSSPCDASHIPPLCAFG